MRARPKAATMFLRISSTAASTKTRFRVWSESALNLDLMDGDCSSDARDKHSRKAMVSFCPQTAPTAMYLNGDRNLLPDLFYVCRDPRK